MATPEEMAASMLANLEEKTGKPLEGWLPILAASGLEKHGQLLKLLKTEHGVTHGFANLIVHHYRTADAGQANLVAAQYTGKESLRPIYDALLERVMAFGNDVEISPKKSYVSLRRKKQFGQIQPATKTRVDVGLNLKGDAATSRLKAATGMCTHKVGMTEVSDIDSELLGWLRRAYDAAG